MAVIVCDCDNVLNNLQEVVVGLFNERYDANYTLNDFQTYDVTNSLPYNEAVVMTEMYSEYGLCDLVKPALGAQSGLEKLVNAGHQVYIVTHHPPKTYGEKVEWIKKYFPFINDDHIVCMKHKWLLKADIMIEDCVETLLAKPFYERILVDYPWNRHVRDYPYNIHRCTNWNEIVDVVNKINDGE